MRLEKKSLAPLLLYFKAGSFIALEGGSIEPLAYRLPIDCFVHCLKRNVVVKKKQGKFAQLETETSGVRVVKVCCLLSVYVSLNPGLCRCAPCRPCVVSLHCLLPLQLARPSSPRRSSCKLLVCVESVTFSTVSVYFLQIKTC